jgi:hypothetical protein
LFEYRVTNACHIDRPNSNPEASAIATSIIIWIASAKPLVVSFVGSDRMLFTPTEPGTNSAQPENRKQFGAMVTSEILQ